MMLSLRIIRPVALVLVLSMLVDPALAGLRGSRSSSLSPHSSAIFSTEAIPAWLVLSSQKAQDPVSSALDRLLERLSSHGMSPWGPTVSVALPGGASLALPAAAMMETAPD